MDYSVSVSLEFGAVDTFFIRMLSSACVRCQKSIRRQKVLFPLKKKLAYVRHKTTSIHINIIITHFYYLIYAKKSKNTFFISNFLFYFLKKSNLLPFLCASLFPELISDIFFASVSESSALTAKLISTFSAKSVLSVMTSFFSNSRFIF